MLECKPISFLYSPSELTTPDDPEGSGSSNDNGDGDSSSYVSDIVTMSVVAVIVILLILAFFAAQYRHKQFKSNATRYKYIHI